MMEYITDQIRRYFGSDVQNLRLLGVTKYTLQTYVKRVRAGQSKDYATSTLLQGRTLDDVQIQFIRSVLDRLPAVQRAGSWMP